MPCRRLPQTVKGPDGDHDLNSGRNTRGREVRVQADAALALAEAALDVSPVAGHTHDFYRYPARFSPRFVRKAIETFTDPGDVVIDPFMGGGTTAVEGFALARRVVGTDISSLACFVADVKTTLLTPSNMNSIREWFVGLPPMLNLRRKMANPDSSIERDLCRNIAGRRTWPIRKAIRLAIAQLHLLASGRQRRLARCVLLKTGQWALDGRLMPRRPGEQIG